MAGRTYAAMYNKQQLQDIARGILNANTCFLDTETTGCRSKDEVITIGIIDKDENILFDKIIKPTIPISESATKIHGITDEMVANCKDFKSISDELLMLLQSHTPVAIYNEAFDLRLISQTASKFNLYNFVFDGAKIPGIISQDVMLIISQWFQDEETKTYKWKKLVDCYQALCPGQELKAHDAVADCTMTVRCLRAIANADLSVNDDVDQEEDYF